MHGILILAKMPQPMLDKVLQLLARFAPGPAQTLPGRAEPVAVWLAR